MAHVACFRSIQSLHRLVEAFPYASPECGKSSRLSSGQSIDMGYTVLRTLARHSLFAWWQRLILITWKCSKFMEVSSKWLEVHQWWSWCSLYRMRLKSIEILARACGNHWSRCSWSSSAQLEGLRLILLRCTSYLGQDYAKGDGDEYEFVTGEKSFWRGRRVPSNLIVAFASAIHRTTLTAFILPWPSEIWEERPRVVCRAVDGKKQATRIQYVERLLSRAIEGNIIAVGYNMWFLPFYRWSIEIV